MSVNLKSPPLLLLVLFFWLSSSPNLHSGVSPKNDRIIYSTHVLFEWDTQPNTRSYIFQIDEYNPDERFNAFLDTCLINPGIIVKSGIEFGISYSWRFRRITGNSDTLNWSRLYQFSTVAVPDSVLAPSDTINWDDRTNNISYEIYNTGELEQTFHFSFQDEAGWYFQENGYFRVNAGGKHNLDVFGDIPDDREENRLFFRLVPLNDIRNPEVCQSYVTPEYNYAENQIGAKNHSLIALYPNPFNSLVNISFDIPGPQIVRIGVYNSQGKFVAEIQNAFLSAGGHSVVWSGKTRDGKKAPSGTYFIVISWLEKRFWSKASLIN